MGKIRITCGYIKYVCLYVTSIKYLVYSVEEFRYIKLSSIAPICLLYGLSYVPNAYSFKNRL